MTMTLARTSRAAPDGVPPEQIPVTGEPMLLHRRRGALLLVGVAAAAAAAAHLWRAVYGGGPVSYVVAAVLVPVAVVHLASWWDARIPLLVADETGIRLRRGRAWVGLRWDEVQAVTLSPARLPRRDARLDVGMVESGGRRLPLAMVDPVDVRALPDALRRLAPPAVAVAVAAPAVATPAPDEVTVAEPAVADPPPAETVADPPVGAHLGPGSGRSRSRWRGLVARPLRRTTSTAGAGSTPYAREESTEDNPEDNLEDGAEDGVALLPQPRHSDAVRAARAEVTIEGSAGSSAGAASSAGELRPRRTPVQLEEAVVATVPRAVAPDSNWHGDPNPVADPVIGPQIVEARRRLRLSVDELAERTRIRPHVIESIEVDDFSACGGDVYARGHLRVLARVLGVEATQLLDDYDERYAAGPVTARSVLEAELASTGRSASIPGGPRWSVLVAVVLVLALVWIAARLLVPAVDGAAAGRDEAPRQQSTASAGAGAAADAAERFAGMGTRVSPTRLRLAGVTDAEVGTPVTVTGKDGAVVFQGTLGAGDVERVDVVGAATVVATDGGLVVVQVDGRRIGTLGPLGKPVRRTLGG